MKTERQTGSGPTIPVADYRCDGTNNCLQQVDLTGSTPLTTTYTNDILGLSQVLVANDGTTQTTNLFGLDLISQDDGTDTRYILADGLGSGRTEMVGNSVETVTTYEPFGNPIAQTGSSGTVYGFTGEQLDMVTNLQYLRARYYSPSLKTFLSRDPYPGHIALPASQHPYQYVQNNPVNLTDPTGNCPWCLVGAGLFYFGNVIHQTHRNMQNGMDFWDAIYYKNHDQATVLRAIKNGALLPLELLPGVDGAIDGAVDQLIGNLTNPCAGLLDGVLASAGKGAAFDLAFFGAGSAIKRLAAPVSVALAAAIQNAGNKLDNIGGSRIATLLTEFKPGAVNWIPGHDEVAKAAREQLVADYLESIGREVKDNLLEGIPNAGRQGDNYVDGVLTEFKAVAPSFANNTVKNIINESLRRGGQAPNIIIDARATTMSMEEAIRGIYRGFGLPGATRLNVIEVIGNGFHVIGNRP